MKTDNSTIIEHCLTRFGNDVRFLREDGSVLPARAMVQPAWTRMKLHFEEKAGKAGRYVPLYFYYIGPACINILQETEDTVLLCGGEKYYFTQKEAVTVAGTVQYYRGILKQFKEEANVSDD